MGLGDEYLLRRREVPDGTGSLKAQAELRCGCWVDIPWRYKREGEIEDVERIAMTHRCPSPDPKDCRACSGQGVVPVWESRAVMEAGYQPAFHQCQPCMGTGKTTPTSHERVNPGSVREEWARNHRPPGRRDDPRGGRTRVRFG